MATRIEVDENLIAQAMRNTGVHSRAAVVDLALQTLLEMALAEGRGEDGWLKVAAPCEDEAVEAWPDERFADLTFFAAYLGLPDAG